MERDASILTHRVLRGATDAPQFFDLPEGERLFWLIRRPYAFGAQISRRRDSTRGQSCATGSRPPRRPPKHDGGYAMRIIRRIVVIACKSIRLGMLLLLIRCLSPEGTACLLASAAALKERVKLFWRMLF